MKDNESRNISDNESGSFPLIGIVPQIDTKSPFRHIRLFPNYLRALDRSGAAGIVLPFTKDAGKLKMLIELCDGFLLTGGQDIDPRLYGAEAIKDADYAPERDAFEPFLFPMIFASGKPVLAVCRGMQMVNVLNGGTLYGDLPGKDSPESQNRDFVLHPDWEHPLDGVHEINVAEGTLLHKIAGTDRIRVNSLHHQGVDKLGEGLTVAGTAPDGLVEAFDIEGPEFGLGIQWHPEALFDGDELSRKIFAAFVEAARKNCENKNE